MTSEVDIATFAEAHADGALVLDVREPHEYVGGHVPGAHLVPVSELPSRLAEVPRGEPVYVICASGNRSRAMTDLLVRHGVDAYSGQGGTGGWVRTGRPVLAGLDATPSERRA